MRVSPVILAVALALTMGGCKTVGGGLDIPASRFVSKPEPAIPAPPVTDEENGNYLRGLHGALLDCKSKLEWLFDYVKPK